MRDYSTLHLDTNAGKGTGIVLYIVKQTCDLDVLKRSLFSIMVRYVCENDRKVFIHSRLVGWSYGV
jgi:hypothetical protein